MRDFKKYAEQGRQHIHNTKGYDITATELDTLYDMINESESRGGGLFYALSLAYYAGIEAGYRIKTKEGDR